MTQSRQRRVTYLLSYIHVRNPVWIETTVCLYLLYICHPVIHRELQNVVYMKKKSPICLEIGLFLLCIYYSPWKHTLIFIYSSWQLSMEHIPLAICDFQTTFLKTRIKATEVCRCWHRYTQYIHKQKIQNNTKWKYKYNVQLLITLNSNKLLLVACRNLQTTFLKTRIKATEVCRCWSFEILTIR
jgi:hypothetical protein